MALEPDQPGELEDFEQTKALQGDAIETSNAAQRREHSHSVYNHCSSQSQDGLCTKGSAAIMAPILLWLVMVIGLLITIVKYVMGILLKLSFPNPTLPRSIDLTCLRNSLYLPRPIWSGPQAHLTSAHVMGYV
jgi:hypothetical protein